MQLKAQLSNSGSDYRLEYGNNSISTKQVQAVWMRRIWQPYLGEELAPQFKAACAKESLATLDSFSQILHHNSRPPRNKFLGSKFKSVKTDWVSI